MSPKFAPTTSPIINCHIVFYLVVLVFVEIVFHIPKDDNENKKTSRADFCAACRVLLYFALRAAERNFAGVVPVTWRNAE